MWGFQFHFKPTLLCFKVVWGVGKYTCSNSREHKAESTSYLLQCKAEHSWIERWQLQIWSERHPKFIASFNTSQSAADAGVVVASGGASRSALLLGTEKKNFHPEHKPYWLLCVLNAWILLVLASLIHTPPRTLCSPITVSWQHQGYGFLCLFFFLGSTLCLEFTVPRYSYVTIFHGFGEIP